MIKRFLLLPQMQFMPTGSINAKNVLDYLAFKKVAACRGSWIVKPELISKESSILSAIWSKKR